MLPAELMGFNPNKFRQLNNLIKDKKFVNSLVSSVNSIISFSKNKSSSIILNYDPQSEDFFEWYKQLAAESLGKKNKGFLPVISNMPKDNHSMMQLYLDGPKKNFFTFFSFKGNSSLKIKSNFLSPSNKFLKNKSINQIKMCQKMATENIFKKKNIPFRSFEIKKRDEKTLGELFIFFILETILLANALGVNPYDQPSVELIKKETKKQLN
jgi:glucose-6-phosphate isomerase